MSKPTISKTTLLNTLKDEQPTLKPSEGIIGKNVLLSLLDVQTENESLKEFRPKDNYNVLLVKDLVLTVKTYHELTVATNAKASVTFFALTDMFGGFFNSFNVVKPLNYFNYTGIITDFQGATPLYGNKGDAVYIFTGYSPHYQTNVVVSTGSNYTYGMMLGNLMDDVYIIDSLKINLTDANIDNFDNNLFFSKVDIFGKVHTSSLSLRTYVTPESFQTKIIEIPLKIVLDKNLIINQHLNYNFNSAQYTFKLLKIK